MRETVLPATAGTLSCERPKEVLSRAGVVFHEPVSEDSQLYRVTLPCGWTKVPTGPMSFRLLDDRGRERAQVFESDRPFISLSRRFRVKRDIHREIKENQIVAMVVGADGVVSFTTQVFQVKEETPYDHRFNLGIRATEEAEEWLDKYFPHWRDPGSHWD